MSATSSLGSIGSGNARRRGRSSFNTVECVLTSSDYRTFAEVKEAKGEWKADPRFQDSWYFVREAEEQKDGKK